MSRLRSDEGGWALVTALLLMTIMLGFGLSTLTLVDTQQRQSADGRRRETAFNVAEAALNAQTYQLARNWPGKGGAANTALRYPSACTQASTDTRCPTTTTLQSLYSSQDTTPAAQWSATVRDNSGSAGAETFWSEGMLSSAPTYDANGDGKLWVRSTSTASRKSRTMVALVRTEPQQEDLPRAALIAGALSISNMGKKKIIDAHGPSASTGAVSVRCTPSGATDCLGHGIGGGIKNLADLMSLLDIQISPNSATYGYTGGAALPADALARLKSKAIADGTYFTSCPTSLAGTVVYLELTSTCSYTGNSTFNTATAPGSVIMTGGALSIGGTVNYYGVIYNANLANLSGTLVDLQGNATVQGGVVIDGLGSLTAGSSGVNLIYDDRGFAAVDSNGSAGLVQNTWREIR
jgi:Tfp pilus assembly protein PilX